MTRKLKPTEKSLEDRASESKIKRVDYDGGVYYLYFNSWEKGPFLEGSPGSPHHYSPENWEDLPLEDPKAYRR